ncbi:MAG: efflux RND transporter permease subunit [Alphaproteobacteria bacterium]|nr:efflux RND transporter permease subunit [Alphaproteobacteria bacterium]MBP9776897.1 efflux RND transporter permease subunit [Alphaproteobacteria bacterium]
MFTSLIAWSLNNRFLALAFTLLVVIWGGYTLQHMPVDVFPEFAPPQVVIQTESPGMSPQDVEALITYPLESAINGTPGVTRVRSRTAAGLSTIVIVFDDATDVYRDRQLVNEKIQQIMERLPAGIKGPTMLPVTSAVGWMIKYALMSDTISPEDLRTISDWEIRPRILALGGIASVVSTGGEVKQYQILLDAARMFAYHISPSDVRQALEKANTNVPGAFFLGDSGQELIISAIGRVHTLEDLKKTVITVREGIPITIDNVATVTYGGEIKRGDGAFNLKKAVIGTVSKAYGADTLTTTYRVEKVLEEIKKILPFGVTLDTQVFRQANFIDSAIYNLKMALLEGAVIVVVILFIFLMNWRASLITFLSIPLSFVGGVLVMNTLGMGINVMTLGGLAIAIGEVVDDGIITVENVVRRLRLNRSSSHPLPAIEIVFDAILEIRSSVVYATMIICMVFIPIFFLEGIAARIFSPLGVAYIASVIASLLVSILTLPALCYLLLVRSKEKEMTARVVLHESIKCNIVKNDVFTSTAVLHAEKETPFAVWLKDKFSSILNWSLRHCFWVIGLATTALILALVLLSFFGRAFLPEFHEGNFIISMNTLPGTSLEESMRLGKLVRQNLLKYPQVISISQRAGRNELDEDAESPNFSEFDILLDFDKDKNIPPVELIKRIREDLAKIPGTIFNVGQFIAHRMDEVLSGVRAQVAVKVFGEDLSILNEIGQSIERTLRTVPGVVDINREQQISVPQITIKIDREKALRYGAQVGTIADSIQTYLNGVVVSSILEGQRSFDLFLRLDDKDRNTLNSLHDLFIDIPETSSSKKPKIPLRAVAKIAIENQPYSIKRENVQRLITVAFNVEGRNLGSVIHDVQKGLQEKIKLPSGYYIEYGGQFESQQQATRILLIFGGLILFATLILLFKVFGTFREAFLVVLNVPFALIGGIFSLFLAGAEMSIAAMIGFITLFGITMRNGIILVSRYNQLRAEKKPLQEIVVQGALDRLVPVLMTASTAALGLIPLLWGSPVGKELERPLAQVLLGGLFTSTMLNMIVIPTLYFHIEKWREWQREKHTRSLQDK